MRLPRLPAVSIFWQTLLLLMGYMVITYLVTSAFIYTGFSSEPSFIGTAEIAERLSGKVPTATTAGPHLVERVTLTSSLEPPPRPEGMTSAPGLTADIARRLGTPTRWVRLYFAPDQRRFLPFTDPGRSDPIPRWRGQALFFDGVVAAVRRGPGWRILTMPRSPRASEWRRRQVLIPTISGLLLILTAFLFARHLSGPIRRFATSADLLGSHASASPVPIKGPAELRTAAMAINAMQRRIEEILRERTEMIAAIAHDLRTPLARIAFRVESSAETIREPVLDDIDQMREMIAAALDFSRAAIDTHPSGECDLAAVIEEIVRSARELGQEICANVTGPLPVRGDPLTLKRMLQNLVENAGKYADDAGIKGTLGQDIVTIEVSDRGPGLPEAMLERVLAPFVRNEPSRSRETGGVGLGLAISKAIASKHGGDLVLINRAEGGLIARVTLPVFLPSG